MHTYIVFILCHCTHSQNRQLRNADAIVLGHFLLNPVFSMVTHLKYYIYMYNMIFSSTKINPHLLIKIRKNSIFLKCVVIIIKIEKKIILFPSVINILRT